MSTTAQNRECVLSHYGDLMAFVALVQADAGALSNDMSDQAIEMRGLLFEEYYDASRLWDHTDKLRTDWADKIKDVAFPETEQGSVLLHLFGEMRSRLGVGKPVPYESKQYDPDIVIPENNYRPSKDEAAKSRSEGDASETQASDAETAKSRATTGGIDNNSLTKWKETESKIPGWTGSSKGTDLFDSTLSSKSIVRPGAQNLTGTVRSRLTQMGWVSSAINRESETELGGRFVKNPRTFGDRREQEMHKFRPPVGFGAGLSSGRKHGRGNDSPSSSEEEDDGKKGHRSGKGSGNGGNGRKGRDSDEDSEIEEVKRLANLLDRVCVGTSSSNRKGTRGDRFGPIDFKRYGKIAKFTGNFHQFHEFYHLFLEMVDYTDEKPPYKLNLLREKLDKGSLDIIEGLGGNQYHEALYRLVQHYFSVTAVYNDIWRELSKLPKITSSDYEGIKPSIVVLRKIKRLFETYNLDRSYEMEVIQNFYDHFPTWMSRRYTREVGNGNPDLALYLFLIEQCFFGCLLLPLMASCITMLDKQLISALLNKEEIQC